MRWFKVQALAGSVPEVAIRGIIGSGWCDEDGDCGATDTDLIQQVQALGNIQQLNVIINSTGGDAAMALGIFNFLRSLNIEISVRVEGVALSSGSIVAMAASPGKLTMPANTLMMAHKPWTFTAGNADELRRAAADLDVWTQALVQVYMTRTQMTAEQVNAFLAEERTMTAEEAVQLGFADVVEPLTKANLVNASFRRSVMACALGVPDAVLDRVAAIEAAATDAPPAPADPAPPTVVPAAPLALQISDEAKAAGLEKYSSVFALAATSLEAARARIGVAREIQALAEIAKLPDLGHQLIMASASYEQACQRLTDARAQADEATQTDGHPPNPLSIQPQPAGPQAITTASIWAARKLNGDRV